MKKQIILIALIVLVVTGFAHAQTITYTGRSTNTDGTPFTITQAKEKNGANDARTLVTKIVTIGGAGSHLDLILNAEGILDSVEMYGYTKSSSETTRSLKHILSCSGADSVGISNEPANPRPATYNQALKSVTLCSFNPDGIDNGPNGFAYVTLVGIMKTSSGIPSTIIISSATIGGGFESSDGGLVFKGTFTTTLKPQ